MTTADQAVANGAKYLDEFGPEGWRDKIDLATLDVRRLRSCPLGQLYGGFYVGWEKMSRDLDGARHADASWYGFDIHMDIDNEEMVEAWRKLLAGPNPHVCPVVEPEQKTIKLNADIIDRLHSHFAMIQSEHHPLTEAVFVVDGVRIELHA